MLFVNANFVSEVLHSAPYMCNLFFFKFSQGNCLTKSCIGELCEQDPFLTCGFPKLEIARYSKLDNAY